MEAIETSEEASSEKESKISALSKQIDLEKKAASTKVKSLDKRLGKLTSDREKRSGEISKRLMHQYNFIRTRRGGTAIVASTNGCCQGCFMQLPPQLYIEVQRSRVMHACPSCQRILFYQDPEE